MTPEQEIHRANSARQLLNDPLFVEARQFVEDQLAHIRRTVPVRETEMHTRVILMGQLADKFFAYFEQIAQTGQMAELRLAEEQQKQSLLEKGIAIFGKMGRNSL